MRVFLISILVGCALGLGVGYGLGATRSALRPWDVSLEENRGDVFANVGKKETHEEAEHDHSHAEKAPRVKVDEIVYDFGILEKNPSQEKGEHLFYIENVGTDTLKLAKGAKACFCTDFTISKTSVKPGDKATVTFKWDAARSGGVFNQGVSVLTNDPEMKDVRFYVKGLYTAPIISDPSELVFQSATTSATVARPFRILGFEKNEDGSPFDLQITKIELTDPEHFEVEINKDDIANLTPEDHENRLHDEATNLFNGALTMKPGMPQGAFQEMLRLTVNSEKTPIFEIPIRGHIISSAIKVVGPLYDDKIDGMLKLDSVKQETGKTTTLRITVLEAMPANSETIFVKGVKPKWLKVELTYPPEELQKVSPIRMIEASVQVPQGAPLGGFMGSDKDRLGEIVFSIGATPETSQELVVPVRFAVTP